MTTCVGIKGQHLSPTSTQDKSQPDHPIDTTQFFDSSPYYAVLTQLLRHRRVRPRLDRRRLRYPPRCCELCINSRRSESQLICLQPSAGTAALVAADEVCTTKFLFNSAVNRAYQ